MYELNSFAPKLIVIAIVLAVLAMIATSSFHVVEPGQRGVRVQLGTIYPDAVEPGLTFKIPFIQTITNISVKQITVNSKAETFSSDLQTVLVNYSVLFEIPASKLVELFSEIAGEKTAISYYRELIEPRVQEQLKQVTSNYKAEDIVKERPQIKVQSLEGVRNALAGLMDVNDLVITNIDLTDELEAAIERKQVAEQEAQKKDYELAIARKEAEIAIVKAEGEAKAIQTRGEALRASPEVIELQIAEKWDGKTPQTVVTGQGGSNVLLPLK